MKRNLDELTDEQITQLFQEAVRQAIEDSKRKGFPICQFDTERMQSYILYPDGRREYAETELRTERSENNE